MEGYLGPYKILGQLASGRASEVYAVASNKLPDAHEVYALKIRAECELAERVAERVAADAKASTRFSDPHIARIHDAFAYERRLHYVTDLVAGETLDDMLTACGGKFPPLVAVVIAIELANALHEAHNQGDSMGRPLVHGDVCPQNVMLTHQGRVVLLDLGVALTDSRIRHDSRSALGHAGYVAPERLRDVSEVDARSDVYSVGLLLWEMLVGKPAIRGASDAEIATRALKPKIPPLSSQAKVSTALEAIVEEAIRPLRNGRCPTARRLSNALCELKSARLATWDRRAEIEKLVLHHFGTRARAKRTLLDRWRGQVADPSKPSAQVHIPIRTPRSISAARLPAIRPRSRPDPQPPPNETIDLFPEIVPTKAAPPPLPPLTPPPFVRPEIQAVALAEPVLALEAQVTDDLTRPKTADLPRHAPTRMSFVAGLFLCLAGAFGLIASSALWPAFAQGWALRLAAFLAELLSKLAS